VVEVDSLYLLGERLSLTQSHQVTCIEKSKGHLIEQHQMVLAVVGVIHLPSYTST